MSDDQIPISAGQSSPASAPAFRSFLVPLLLMTSIFFIGFMSRIIQAPLMPNIEKDMGLTHGTAGSLFFVASLGYFIGTLGSGFIASRINHRRTIIFSTVALSMTIFVIAFSSGLWGLRIGLFALGLTAGPYMPSAFAAITEMVGSRHWGKALAIHELAPNLGFVTAPLVAEAVLYVSSWRGAFAVLGLAALILVIIFARYSRGGDFKADAPTYAHLRVLLAVPAFWIMIILFSLSISSLMGVYTMLPLYLVTDCGLDRSSANTLVALSKVSGIVMAFVGGWATDRFGPKNTLVVVFLFTGIMTILLGISPGSWVPIIVFFQPLLAGCFFPAGFAALALITSPKDRSIAISLTTPAAFLIGGGAVPTFIGFIGDMSSFSVAFAMVGGLVLAGAFISQFLKLEPYSQQD
jgi:NNP family nitrate/nitrite transporter-like MFS transporter